MKRFLLIILSIVLIFCFCSCKQNNVHRSIVFDDGTVICFDGDCGVYDSYIRYKSSGFKLGVNSYVSISGRDFQIIECSCDVLEE